MKHLLFCICCLALVTTLSGQTQKGSQLLGGQIDLSNNFLGDDSNLFSIGLSPDWGYFIGDDLALGGRMNLNYVNTSGSSLTSFYIGPFVRYYFPGEGRTRIFGELGLGGGTIAAGGLSSGFFEWNIGPGLALFLNEHVAFEFTLMYDGSSQSNTYFSEIDFRIGLQVYMFKSN